MTEEKEHKLICDYLKLKYPDVIFTSDASGLRLPMGLAKKFSKLKSGRGIPDLIILEPKGGYSGLVIELKKSEEKIYKKDGKTFKTPHLIEQAIVLDRLKKKGYASYFAIGYKMAVEIIDDYFNNK